jgi:hypothetical protein
MSYLDQYEYNVGDAVVACEAPTLLIQSDSSN